MNSITFILAQLFGAISGIVYIVSTFQKTHKKIVGIQCIDSASGAISDILLGGYAGAVIKVVAVVRNLLSYKNKMNKQMVFTIVCIQIITTVIIVDVTKILNWLPLIASTSYTFGIHYGKCSTTKIYMALNLTLWVTYNVCIKSYTLAIFNLVGLASVITTLVIDKGKMKEE